MKQWVVLCMLASVTFSGCLGFLDDDATTDADPDAMDGMGGNETVNATNTAPVVDFTANRTEGEVPFDVRFDFNASDADEDNLTWTLDVDGDGTVDSNGTGAALPFNFTFTYDAAGTFNATLNVTDGTNATVGVVSINATEPEEGGEEAFTGQTETGEWVTGAQNCPHVLATGHYEGIDPTVLANGDGITWGYFEVDPASIGKTWTLETSGSPAVVQVELSFYATDGSYISYTFDESGKVPANAGHGLVFPCDAGPGSFTYTVA